MEHLKIERARGAAGICGQYHIIHRPTGMIVHAAGRRTTERLIRELQLLDWNFTNPNEIPSDTQSRGRELIQAARKWEDWQVEKKLRRAQGSIVDTCY